MGRSRRFLDLRFLLLLLAIPLILLALLWPRPEPPPFSFLKDAHRLDQRVVNSLNNLPVVFLEEVEQVYEMNEDAEAVKQKMWSKTSVLAERGPFNATYLSMRQKDYSLLLVAGRLSRAQLEKSPSVMQIVTDRDRNWTTILVVKGANSVASIRGRPKGKPTFFPHLP